MDKIYYKTPQWGLWALDVPEGTGADVRMAEPPEEEEIVPSYKSYRYDVWSTKDVLYQSILDALDRELNRAR